MFRLVNNISLTKPDKAKAVESMLIQMAQSGQIVSKVSTILPRLFPGVKIALNRTNSDHSYNELYLLARVIVVILC